MNNDRQRYHLIKKYTKYNEEYENPDKLWLFKGQLQLPLLIDALATGCKLPYAKHSIDNFDETTMIDIKNIIRLFPDSLNCDLGQLRCREYVTPLVMAAANENVPIEILKYLIENGADVNKTYKFNCEDIALCQDLKYNCESTERNQKIIKLLES